MLPYTGIATEHLTVQIEGKHQEVEPEFCE